MIELSRHVFEALRKDEEFILYRGRSGDDASQAASASSLGTLRRALGSEAVAVEAAENRGRDLASAESGSAARLILDEGNASQEPRRSPADAGHSRVLVLSPIVEHPRPETLKRSEHEYSLREELDSTWAVRPIAIARHWGRAVLVLEDPGGVPLDQLLDHPLDLASSLRLAIGLTTAIARLHQRGIIHKDIKPANVLVNSISGQCWLMGFGIASRLPRERQSPEAPEFIAGTLPYMAPEQTGRMNRSIDSRSDLYSLGVTLYEMLTGVLPFEATDPMEWVHCHIARQPIPPTERLKGIPEAVSAIVMKLLAKNAEERYQTAAGLEADLRNGLAAWETSGWIQPFSLGTHDMSDRLVMPEKLYGRERESKTLLDAFDQVVATGTPNLVLVSGYSGIGKSSIVNELHKAIVLPHGIFVSGKFDRHKRDIPYATLAQAFQTLIRRILSKREVDVDRWRSAIREAVGPNGQLMVNLMPELELVIGKQPSVADLPSQDAQIRFQMVFRRFLGVFARSEHPLALFLDDLQWLDKATLDLLEHLLTHSEVRSLLLVGAYRDNEVGPAHSLLRTLEAIHKANARVHEIVLTPLGLDDIGRLIVDALHCEAERAQPLARLVQEKTGGNPFFVIQFLTALADEGLLAFDRDSAVWAWDVARIQAKRYTDNIADLMAGKLNRLPASTQNVLQQLACLGNAADITTVVLVRGESEAAIHAALWDAVRAGLVFRTEDVYAFLHDRVQEAAYALIPEGGCAEAHLRIGRVLLASRTAAIEIEEKIFEIASQLNRGVALITAPQERERVAELNLIAGKRAKISTAYASALGYLVAGCALLAEDSWEQQYALTFALEFERAECEFLTSDFAAAEERLSMLSGRARNLVDSAAVTRLRAELYTTLDQSDRAVEVGLEYLRRIGVDWSPHPTKDQVRQEYAQIWRQLGSRAIEALVELPPMTDPACRATLDVLTVLEEPAHFTDENLRCLIVARMANLSLKNGNSDGSCVAYVDLGWFVIPRFSDYQPAFRFGKLGLDLVEKRGLERFRTRVFQCFGYFINPWKRHLRTSVELLRRSFITAQETGDLKYAIYTCDRLVTLLLAVGDPLSDVQREAENGLEFARKAKFGYTVDIIAGQLALIRTLRGLTSSLSSFNDAEFDEGRFEQHLEADPHLVFARCWYWIRKLQALFYAGDYVSALAAASKAEPLLRTMPYAGIDLPDHFVSSKAISRPGVFESAEYLFYDALARAAQYDSASSEERPRHREALIAHQKQLEAWATNCPENFGNRAALVAAEIARIEARELDAERLYEQAVRLSRAQGFIQNEAVAHELAARFHFGRNLETIGHAYLRNARYCYLRWGADGKVWQLDEAYPYLREELSPLRPATRIAAPVEHLDLAAIIKVSQATSGEIVLDKLIDTLLRTALEQAGAGRGLLMLRRGVEQRIEAEARSDRDKVVIDFRPSLIVPSELPELLVRYVIRTQETVILSDASAENIFSADKYIRRKRPRSVLCLPLIKQRQLIGILYFENNLAPGVFTPNRLAMLELIASQAAISLEQARLYAELTHANEELQAEISERRRAEEALQRSEAYLCEAQRLSHTGSCGWDASGGKIYWSQETFRILEYDPPTEPTLELVFRRTHPEDRELVRRVIDRVTHERTDFDFEHRLLMPDGSVKYVRVVGHPSTEGESGNFEIVGAVTDITERKRAEEALQRAQAELAHVMRVATLGELTASIAHEINQPLAAAVNNASACLRWLAARNPEEAQQAASLVMADVLRAGEIIGRIRALAKKAPPQKDRLDLNETIGEVIVMARNEVQRSRVSLMTQLAHDLPLILGDRIQLQQVILNLLINAVEAMCGLDESPRELWISSQKVTEILVESEEDALEYQALTEGAGTHVLIAVRDSGPGLNLKGLDRLFDAFYTTKPQGLGMGLAISRSIIEAHGGRLWATANAPHGAVFQFTLPMRDERRS